MSDVLYQGIWSSSVLLRTWLAVLLKIYAHCIDGQADAANERITDALGAKDPEPGPEGEEDGDSEQAP